MVQNLAEIHLKKIYSFAGTYSILQIYRNKNINSCNSSQVKYFFHPFHSIFFFFSKLLFFKTMNQKPPCITIDQWEQV